MTFHEKSRWIAPLANPGVWGWYFVTAARAFAAGAVLFAFLFAECVRYAIEILACRRGVA